MKEPARTVIGVVICGFAGMLVGIITYFIALRAGSDGSYRFGHYISSGYFSYSTGSWWFWLTVHGAIGTMFASAYRLLRR